MRRMIALSALAALALPVLGLAGQAQAETWTGYSAVSPTGIQWSFDADYSFIDSQSKRIVVLNAIGKVGATPRMGPSAPGASDGVGSVLALDCKAKNLILISGYSPKKPLDINSEWRAVSPKRVETEDDKALLAAVCPMAAKLPVK